MTCIQFPDNPTIGQEVVVGNVTYRCTATTPKPIWESVTAPLKISQITDDGGLDESYNRQFDTLADAVASTLLKEGTSIEIKERTAGDGGGATWDVVLASTVSPNSFNIVQCVGVPTLALASRRVGTPYLEGSASGIGLNFMQQLNAGRRDTFMLVQGDSTGNETTEWVYLVALHLQSLFPAYTVNYYLWNDGAGNYDAPVVIGSGTGSFTLHIYNGSVAGSSAVYFNGSRKPNVYANRDFDLIIQNYGHNGASAAPVNDIVTRVVESVSQLIADQPDAEVALTLQNIDTSLEDFSARQVQATKIAADLFGVGIIDVRSVFRWKQLNGSLGDWMSDSVHPNSVGQAVWASIVIDSLTNPNKHQSRKVNSLPVKMSSPMVNGYFNNWAWNKTEPASWSVGGAATTKETTIKETFSWSVKAVGTVAGFTGSLFQQLDDYLLQRKSGSGLTFLARVYVPSTNGTENAGRVEVSTDLGSVAIDPYPEVKDGWTWRMVHIEPPLLDGATTLRLSIFTGDSTDTVYVDRVMLIEGRLPSEPSFTAEALEEYYDPTNVAAVGSNVVAPVTDDSVTLTSTGEAFGSFYINVFGMVPNESYTMTWTYGGSLGTALARAGLNDTGTVIGSASPLSVGTITWRPSSSSGSIQISESLPNVPFTVSDITIFKT